MQPKLLPSSQPPLEPLQVSISDAGRLLGYSKRTIYDLLARGELKSVGTGRLRRIAIVDLKLWQERNRS